MQKVKSFFFGNSYQSPFDSYWNSKKKSIKLKPPTVQWSFAAWQLAEDVWKQTGNAKEKKLVGEAEEPAGKIVQILER